MSERRSNGADKLTALLEAAKVVFARDGYHGSSVQAITEEAGVATGTFYLYFSSKEACFFALMDELYRLVMAAIIAKRQHVATPREKLSVSIAAVIGVFVAHRDLAKIVLVQAGGASPVFAERLSEIHEDFARLVRADLDEAGAAGLIPPGESAITARALVGSIYELISSWLRDRLEVSIDEAVPILIDFNLRATGFEAGPPRASKLR